MQLQLVTAAVKLFLKSPQPRAQQMIQLVLTYATQVYRPPLPFHLKCTCSEDLSLHPCQSIHQQSSPCRASRNSSNSRLQLSSYVTLIRRVHIGSMLTVSLDRWVDSVM